MRTLSLGKTLLVSGCIFLNTAVLGQTVQMTCDANGCNSAMPGQNLHQYSANILDFEDCQEGSHCKFKWEVTNGIFNNNNSTTLIADGATKVDVKWNNVNGNGTIKVTTDKPASQADGCKNCPVGLTVTKTIPIKYLGTPGNIKINGVAYTGSYQFSCGTAPITVSVTPATNATNYAWSYPAGWAKSGSGASITLTPTKNTGGTIKVVASRGDVLNLETFSQLAITRPLPTKPVINSGDILLCNPKTITASATNASSYNWVTTGGITANSGNTNTAQITGVSSGTVKVSATSAVCGVTSAFSNTINVKRSAPLAASLLVTENGGGSPDFMCNGSGVSLHAETAEPGTNFSSWVSSDPANTILNYNGGSAYFNSYVNSCYGVTVVASNCFGSVQKGITICVDNCVKATPTPSIHPNPADDYIDIALGERNTVEIPEQIKIISEAGSRELKSVNVVTDGMLRLNVSDLPRGVYQIVLIYKNLESKSVRVVLQ
ncbi:T9SS type A sorting domain-containing protein [Dyadobacter sp. CY343]|uniref:T9SS type A sorting domain-containing protein n=1 Tax=Dyadobacter sp. CY343 TaxID=2907299 RepID=UPI001F42A5D8|nr:T9SS type A sorting domain-containing protein [Dyadobacter sp. CY343]MCE7061344.1 T9SS type A sorting domain-containing protein [Dyadobacter sp. CY343]